MFGYPMEFHQQYYSDAPGNNRIWYLLMNDRTERIYDLVMSMEEITELWKYCYNHMSLKMEGHT